MDEAVVGDLVLDPRRAEWYESQGLATISGTSFAIKNLEAQVVGEPAKGGGA